ncbi:hypothetical protein EPO15_03945 [bacterium]|nr:MAG: hypothetical protein EPO15_03945 [bacterium]
MKRIALIVALFTACSRPASDSTMKSVADNKAPVGWQTFEDDWFRVSYPEGSDVGGGPEGKQNPEFPTLAVVPPTTKAGKTFSGAFTLQFEKRTNGMLLRDAIQSEVQSGLKARGVLLSGIREIQVKNGKCMSAAINRPTEGCPKDSGTCYAPAILTLCDDTAGRRFNATSILSISANPSALSSLAQQEAETYERILRSLEFKKS